MSSRSSILDDLGVSEELKLLTVLPTIKQVIRGYNYRRYQLKSHFS